MKLVAPLIFRNDAVLLRRVGDVWFPPLGALEPDEDIAAATRRVASSVAGLAVEPLILTDQLIHDSQIIYLVACETSGGVPSGSFRWITLDLVPEASSVQPEAIWKASFLRARVKQQTHRAHPLEEELAAVSKAYLRSVGQFLSGLQRLRLRTISKQAWQPYADAVLQLYLDAAKLGRRLIQQISSQKIAQALPAPIEQRVTREASRLSEDQRQQLIQYIKDYVERGLTWDEAFDAALSLFRNVNVAATGTTAPNAAFHLSATLSAKALEIPFAVYHTARDEVVCPACAPREGRLVQIGSDVYYENLPPLHPRCRCWYLFYKSRQEAREREQIPF